jgi:hypothetical protein
MLKAMRKTLHSETGAVPVVEVVLLVAVLALASFAVYQGYKARHTVNQLSKPVPHQSKQSPSPSPSKSATADWKTYTSKQEGLSFKYPPDWTAQNTGAVDPSGDGVTLTGPTGAHVVWSSMVSGLGGGCDPAKQPHIFFHALTPIPALPNAYVLEYGMKDQTRSVAVVDGTFASSIPLKIGDTGTCMYYALFKSKDGTRNMWLSSGGSEWLSGRALPAADIAMLKTIMLTASYQ